MWARFRPEIESRLVILESAARAFSSGSMTEDQREGAYEVAHKLAGILGTFGLHRGSELARLSELLLAEEAPPASIASEFSSWVSELRTVISQRG